MSSLMTAAVAQQTSTYYEDLNVILKVIHESEHFTDAYEQLEKLILELFDVERMSIYQRSRQQQEIVARFKTGKEMREIQVPISPQSIAGYVALSQKILNIKNPYDINELAAIHPKLKFADRFDKSSSFVTRNMLVLPIMNAGVLLGVLQLINKKNPHFDADDEAKAQELANFLGQKFRYELRGTKNPFDLLVVQNHISKEKLNDIQDKYSDIKEVINRIAAEGRLNAEVIGHSLEIHYQVPYIGYNPEKYHLHSANSQLNSSYLKRNYVAIIADVEENPIIVMAQPNNAMLLMEIENATRLSNYDICVSLPQEILQFLGEHSAGDNKLGDLDDILDEIDTDPEEFEDNDDDLSEDAPTVVRLVNRILHDAKRLDASDIHIDAMKGNTPTSVRMRIDGLCQEIIQIPASHHAAVVARIKIMSRLDISEKRVPQDGKFAVKINGKMVEVRVATIPTVFGEGVVMRILASGGALPFEFLKLAPGNDKRLKEMMTHPHGILLVVGPTGSGKTTTLHAVLGELNRPEKKIWTAEDPVEITQPGLQQVQVQPKIGFNFAAALKAFLRADPDIILIGEMRDKETAHAGIEASLTGHLVLSTLHTNSAPETITRLLDLGLDPVNFSDACVGILAQRLVRTLCGKCKEDYVASEQEVAFIKRHYGEEYFPELGIDEHNLVLKKPVGCKACGDSGYKGRVGIHELLAMTPDLRALVYKESAVSAMKDQAMKDGMRTLVQDGIYKVVKGLTDFHQLKMVATFEE